MTTCGERFRDVRGGGDGGGFLGGDPLGILAGGFVEEKVDDVSFRCFSATFEILEFDDDNSFLFSAILEVEKKFGFFVVELEVDDSSKVDDKIFDVFLLVELVPPLLSANL